MAAAPIQQPGMMQQATDPLAALRDIHLPGMIEPWPPAPGWWLLALLAALAVIALCAWLFRRWRANRYRREAVAELNSLLNDWQQHGDNQTYLAALQRLLKRVALSSFPRENVARLTGEAWVQFLDRSTASHDFSMVETEALIDGNYRQDLEIDVAALQKIARLWIQKHNARYIMLQDDQRIPVQRVLAERVPVA